MSDILEHGDIRRTARPLPCQPVAPEVLEERIGKAEALKKTYMFDPGF